MTNLLNSKVAIENHENENIKPNEVKTSTNNQNEKIINDLLTQSQSELSNFI